MLFNQDFNVLVIATKQEVAKNLVTKVRVMNQYLPSWLKQTTIEDNKLSLTIFQWFSNQKSSSGDVVVLKHYPY